MGTLRARGCWLKTGGDGGGGEGAPGEGGLRVRVARWRGCLVWLELCPLPKILGMRGPRVTLYSLWACDAARARNEIRNQTRRDMRYITKALMCSDTGSDANAPKSHDTGTVPPPHIMQRPCWPPPSPYHMGRPSKK